MNSLISISNANKITNPNGDIYKLLSAKDTGFNGFGEAYISLIDYGAVKAWKRHNKMTMNLLVPFGNVAFVFFDFNGNFETVIIGDSNFKRLTVSPGIWFGFKGISNQKNVVINIADFVHDDSEVDKAKVTEFDYDWDKL